MVKGSRNLCLYPNVYLMDQFSTQIRQFRPIAPNKTEVTIYCIAPKGESKEARSHRIRQYEDFFNASGMATPDDLEEFRSCQLTFQATNAPWNDMSRGAEHWLTGPCPKRSTCTVSSLQVDKELGRGTVPGSARLLAQNPPGCTRQTTRRRDAVEGGSRMTAATTDTAFRSTRWQSSSFCIARPATSTTASSRSGSRAMPTMSSTGCRAGGTTISSPRTRRRTSL